MKIQFPIVLPKLVFLSFVFVSSFVVADGSMLTGAGGGGGLMCVNPETGDIFIVSKGKLITLKNESDRSTRLVIDGPFPRKIEQQVEQLKFYCGGAPVTSF